MQHFAWIETYGYLPGNDQFSVSLVPTTTQNGEQLLTPNAIIGPGL